MKLLYIINIGNEMPKYLNHVGDIYQTENIEPIFAIM